MIPQANPGLQYRRHQAEIEAGIARVLRSGWYILGAEVEAFEREFAAYCGVRHAVGLGSGTDALRFALWGLEVGPGDEVIVPAHTAVATIVAVERVGATPVLVDIEPDTYGMSPSGVEAAITPRTAAIVPVHLYGQAANLTAIGAVARSHGVALVEDAAQAHGAKWLGRRVGGFGALGCFSFYPTKNLAALGDGGMVVTDDAALADRVRMLRQYGWKTRYLSDIPGDVSRLDEVQAAVLRAKLPSLEADNGERRRLAAAYSAGLADVMPTPVTRAEAEHVFHQYVVRSPVREEFRQKLRDRGVGTLVHYPWPIHLQPAYEGRLGRRGQFPVSEQACNEVVSLPLYPGLTVSEAERVIDAVREIGVLEPR
ncbi:MAG: DegT/DnrJ/EryC1/StrS family aminotransferase [Gemmatimonadetes bacterium]|nr:DegT/DnrJ/EryC1/StrS family aminotransferase [Gemmatimonadota bacterium]